MKSLSAVAVALVVSLLLVRSSPTDAAVHPMDPRQGRQAQWQQPDQRQSQGLPQGSLNVATTKAHQSVVAEISRGGAVDNLEATDSEAHQSAVVEMARGGAIISSALFQTLKVGFYFALWYTLNVYYNIVNKKILNKVPAPLSIGSIQLAIGSLYISLLWLFRLRSIPTLTSHAAVLKFRDVGFWHALGQQASMVSLGAGPVSFTHIVKALEPFFSAVVSALAFGKWMPVPVYATLVPVVGGVGYACLKESAFSWLAFGAAMLSNLAFALRAVLSKVAMTTPNSGKNLTSPNVFAIVTLIAFFFSVPMALCGEGSTFVELWKKAIQTTPEDQLIKAVIVSGLFHYLNNEVMYLALGNVHPVTLAVGNTMKRVFIMVASVMVFRNQITFQAGVGSAVGISGVLLYSLVKQHYEKLEKGKPVKGKVLARVKFAKKVNVKR